MRCSAEGILYPRDAKASLLASLTPLKPISPCALGPIEIPHAAWVKCKEDLDKAFLGVAGSKPSLIFLLGPLHKGPLTFDEGFPVYAPEDGFLEGSDWKVILSVPSSLRSMVTISDDICSEEHSLELAGPYLSLLFPSVPVCHLLASGDGENVKKIALAIKKDFPNALVFISNNRETCCAGMWKEAFS